MAGPAPRPRPVPPGAGLPPPQNPTGPRGAGQGHAPAEPAGGDDAIEEVVFEEQGGLHLPLPTLPRLPTDLDGWVPWVAAALVVTAAAQTLLELVLGALEAWYVGSGTTATAFPRPSGYYSLLLLAGVLLLVLRREPARRSRWTRAVACLAAATAAALIVSQVVGAGEAVAERPAGETAPLTGMSVLGALVAVGDAVVAAAALVLAAFLYRWSRPDVASAASRAADAPSAAPLLRPVVAGLAAGAAVAIACLVTFQAGITRNATQVVSPPVQAVPSFSTPRFSLILPEFTLPGPLSSPASTSFPGPGAGGGTVYVGDSPRAGCFTEVQGGKVIGVLCQSAVTPQPAPSP